MKRKLRSLKIAKMIPLKKIEDLITKHSDLERDLSSGKIDKKFFAEKSKEYSDLNEIISDAKTVSYTHLTLPTKA